MQKPQQKKTVFNPFEALENKSRPKTPDLPGIFQSPENIKKMNNFSPMDFAKLNEAYANQDQKSLEEIRKQMNPEQLKEQDKIRFFKRYKQQEEEYYMRRKQEEEEKKRQEAFEEQQKHQQEQAAMAKQGGELPQGKVRKSILGGGKKKATTNMPPPSTVEYKPSKGAQ